uniref:Uncharacterized protein n=1 Tax=Ascaris lumbricoides TaxID=6252 RepID=A0A0M3IP52_ASCLU
MAKDQKFANCAEQIVLYASTFNALDEKFPADLSAVMCSRLSKTDQLTFRPTIFSWFSDQFLR